MSLTKEVSIDKIEIVENGTIQVRQVTRIIEDGVQLSSSYHRWSLEPGSDISDQTETIQSIASVVWTQEVIQKYKESLEIVSTAQPA